MLNYLGSGLSVREMLLSLLLSLPVIVFALCFHECAHAFVAWKMGDPTARNIGRLTLDPLKHLDPIGTITMILFGIGWAKPVPVNSRYFKKPKLGMALTALAGPFSNLVLSFLFTVIYMAAFYLGAFSPLYAASSPTESFGIAMLYIVKVMLASSITLNCYLAVFNMLPIPPFDGSRIAFVLLPDKFYFGVMKHERVIMAVVLVLLWTGILTTPLDWLSDLLLDGIWWLADKIVTLPSLIFK